MNKTLKALVGRTMEATPFLRRPHMGRLVILTFHRVRPDDDQEPRPMKNLEVRVSDFRRMLTWMKQRYAVLSLEEWMRGGRVPPGQASFAVTFDDGWADNYEYAWPVLKELDLPATVFLATSAVEDRIPFWWQRVCLTDMEIERLKTLSLSELNARLLDFPRPRQVPDEFLTWEQTREMGADGRIRFGLHGHRHALMPSMVREAALADLICCRNVVARRLPDAWTPILAWPNGNARHDMEEDLEAMGLLGAVGTHRGVARSPLESRWNLPRNNVDRNLAAQPDLWPWFLLLAR
ncbi:MAG: polysaccharide deacetylase family protein [Verrucomicrobiota bacterium]|jgi:peptidoglycan/xylan/chitin deacetylase (PgdA/CDA1 family)|nr:polysaccharide deacetylase family protein [Verrucomicrobiota bacterium]